MSPLTESAFSLDSRLDAQEAKLLVCLSLKEHFFLLGSHEARSGLLRVARLVRAGLGGKAIVALVGLKEWLHLVQ